MGALAREASKASSVLCTIAFVFLQIDNRECIKPAPGGGEAVSFSCFHPATFDKLQKTYLNSTPTNLKLFYDKLYVFSEQPAQGRVFIHKLEVDKLELCHKICTTQLGHQFATEICKTKSIFDAISTSNFIAAVAEGGLYSFNSKFGMFCNILLGYCTHRILANFYLSQVVCILR